MFLALKRKKSKDLYRESLLLWSRQISDTIKKGQWSNLSKLKRPIKNIVINGMGGSNLGPEIILSLFKKDLSLPITIEPGYDIPGFVNKETVYIISSYSGTTEEPLVAYKKARARGALIIALTAQGENTLSNIATRDGIAMFQFPTTSNPSGQPRLGLGAALSACVIILCQLGVLKKSLIKELEKAGKKFSRNTSIIDTAKRLARRLKGREIVLISSSFFAGNLKTLRNQFNESGKNIASYLTISDMNHHALEGLSYPKSNRKRLAALFIDSKLDTTLIQKRADISKEIFRQQRIPVISFNLKNKTILEQGLELLQFGSWLSYHIAIQNRVDPMSIPWVDWFKKKLSN